MEECKIELKEGYKMFSVDVTSPDGVQSVNIQLGYDLSYEIERTAAALKREASCSAREAMSYIENEELTDFENYNYVVMHPDFREERARAEMNGDSLDVVAYFEFNDGSRLAYDGRLWDAIMN
jgi:hypothetical protein